MKNEKQKRREPFARVARRFFNVLAEEPEVVAADLVPKVRAVTGTNSAIEFLTLPVRLLPAHTQNENETKGFKYAQPRSCFV